MEKKAGDIKGEGQQDRLVDSKEVAKLIGKTSRRVQQLTSDGVLPTIEVKNGKRTLRKYDKYKTVQAYIGHVEMKAEEKCGVDKEKEKLRVEIKTKEAKLKMIELQLAEMEGTMHASEDVEAMTDDLVLCVRANLLAMPGKLSAELAGVSDAAEISGMIEEAVYQVLEELSNYRYNPDEYRRRVKCKNGRRGYEDMEDG